MSDFLLNPTRTTPRIELHAKDGKLWLEGECYPENANAFFEPLFAALERFFTENRALEVNFKLNYFNTSSSKRLLDLLELLEKRVRLGGKVVVIWHYRADDEDILESGREFAEDVKLDFSFRAYD